MTEEGSTRERDDRCASCDRSISPAYRFCPFCGTALRDSQGRRLSAYEVAFGAQIERDRQAERSAIYLWGPAAGRVYLFGALLLTVPDAVLFVIFKRYLQHTVGEALTFLLIDVAVGLLAIFLIRLCAERGPAGELILAGLRLGQVSLVWPLDLMPFGSPHDILNLLLFAGLPLALLAVAALVFHLHLTAILDALSRVDAGEEEEEVAREESPPST